MSFGSCWLGTMWLVATLKIVTGKAIIRRSSCRRTDGSVRCGSRCTYGARIRELAPHREANYGKVHKERRSSTGQSVAVRKMTPGSEEKGVPGTAVRVIALLKELPYEIDVELSDAFCSANERVFVIAMVENGLSMYLKALGRQLLPALVMALAFKLVLVVGNVENGLNLKSIIIVVITFRASLTSVKELAQSFGRFLASRGLIPQNPRPLRPGDVLRVSYDPVDVRPIVQWIAYGLWLKDPFVQKDPMVQKGPFGPVLRRPYVPGIACDPFMQKPLAPRNPFTQENAHGMDWRGPFVPS